MPNQLLGLYEDLNQDKLRVSRPSKLVFLCGGVIADSGSRRAISLRDYLYRVKAFQERIDGPIVLAEKANQLYRETSYGDLITFEEDIARIASVVLVIAESPGALAELGAFATNDTIAQSLRIVMQEKYADAESFVRFGPVERIRRLDRSFIGFYPWATNSNGTVIAASANPHLREIVKFVNGHLERTPNTEFFRNVKAAKQFYIIYWVTYLSKAVSQQTLFGYVSAIFPKMTVNDLRNRLYCMQLANWIGRFPYSGKDYYYTLSARDPFDYSFKDGIRQRDSIRRKLDVTDWMARNERPPKHVIESVTRRRGTIR